MKKTTLYGTLYLAVAMCAIVYFGMTKKVEINDISHDEIELSKVEEELLTDAASNELIIDEITNSAETLMIPLPNNITSNKIIIENHYMESELHIYLSDVNVDFFTSNHIMGKKTNVKEGMFEDLGGGVKLKIKTDGIYEYKSVLENNSLYITFYKPKELYDKIIVIDPSCGGSDTGYKNENSASSSSTNANTVSLYEKDITLSIAKKVRDLLSADDNIKVYFTRIDDVNPDEEHRINLANDVKADAYIRIAVDFDNDASKYGVTCKYNEDFFIPGFGNIELSNIIEESVATSIKGKALGLSGCDLSDYTLLNSEVPSTTVMVGFLSNKQEAILLGREDYLMRIAEGIVEGIKNIK